MRCCPLALDGEFYAFWTLLLSKKTDAQQLEIQSTLQRHPSFATYAGIVKNDGGAIDIGNALCLAIRAEMPIATVKLLLDCKSDVRFAGQDKTPCDYAKSCNTYQWLLFDYGALPGLRYPSIMGITAYVDERQHLHQQHIQSCVIAYALLRRYVTKDVTRYLVALNCGPLMWKQQPNRKATLVPFCSCPITEAFCAFCRVMYEQQIRGYYCPTHGGHGTATAFYCPVCKK
jgi:hypothetical protein